MLYFLQADFSQQPFYNRRRWISWRAVRRRVLVFIPQTREESEAAAELVHLVLLEIYFKASAACLGVTSVVKNYNANLLLGDYGPWLTLCFY